MTLSLTWGTATEEDIPDLKVFVCTSPPPPMAAGTPTKHRHLSGSHWERVVQAGINGLTWPRPSDELLVIGRDEEGIVAVTLSAEIGGPWEVKILAAAVALRVRRKGLGVGDHLAEETIDRLMERADLANEDQLGLWGLIHQRNAASQALASRHGFDYVRDFGEELQEWWQFIDLRL